MINLFKTNRLWLCVSMLLLVVVCCKTKPLPDNTHQEQSVEQPRPATEKQTDSLKTLLDEQRKQKKK
jgi:hypothetical protein